MSVVNVSNFLVELNKKISNTTNDKELLMLTKALEKLKTGVVFTVGTFANLPDPTENVGKLYFVEADALLYFSFIPYNTSSAQWTSITEISANTLWSWGCSNNTGLGSQGLGLDRCSPGTVNTTILNWREICASNLSAVGPQFAIDANGRLWSWGTGAQGSTGTGNESDRFSPGTVAGGGTTWCKVSVRVNSSGAIKTDGTLWTWGSNLNGRLGDGTTVSRCSPGTTWGSYTTWCDIDVGGNIFSAIKCDGTLWTWGSNSFGGLGDGTTIDRSSPGTVAGGGTTWCKISAFYHIAAIKTDGTLWTWGENGQGRIGNGFALNTCSPGTVAGGGTTWCGVHSSVNATRALKTDGTLWTWGSGTYGQLGDGTTVCRCSPGTIVNGGTTWCQISSGSLTSIAIKTDGTLWTWGGNGQGRLGNGTIVDRCSPGTVVGDQNIWWKVSGGANHMLAITKETL